jgi:CheY-like chemotaxis protein
MANIMPVENGDSLVKPRILVVEDEVLIRLSMADELRRAGFTVVEASNVDEALAVLGTDANIDIVLTDIRMPGRLDGIDLARWLRKNMPHIRVAIASANVEPEMQHEFDAIFGKPVYMADVVAKLRQLLPSKEQSGPRDS